MLDLTNVINISVSQTPTGLGNYNVNNVALFTEDVPLVESSSSSSSSLGGGASPAPGHFGAYRIYVSAQAVGDDFGTTSTTYKMAVALFSQQPNILAGGGCLIIFKLGIAETLLAAIARVKDLVFFCGIISTNYPATGSMKTLADSVQSYGDKILILPSKTYADVSADFTPIKAAKDYNTRCIYTSDQTTGAELLFAAAYAGRGFSVDFTGSRTAITMNLKQLTTIDPDEGITQTIYEALATAGVDAYVDYAGVPSIVSNGANKFFDEIYNLTWLVCQLKVVGFNALALVGTKIPQTEPGMSLLKSAYRSVCEQALNNGYVAPGAWNSSEWFGNQNDMINNILERGYYIYSGPVNLQAAADRAARKAPLVQIAIKEAGAIHSTSIIVNVQP